MVNVADKFPKFREIVDFVNKNTDKTSEEPPVIVRNLPGLYGSDIIEILYDKYAFEAGEDLQHLQRVAGQSVMCYTQFKNALLDLIPTVEEAGTIALNIMKTLDPKLTDSEGAIYIAGFQDCIQHILFSQKWNFKESDCV